MNIMNNYVFVFFISLLLYRVEATGFSHTIVWSAPPNTENISHQQLTSVLQISSCTILPFVTLDS